MKAVNLVYGYICLTLDSNYFSRQRVYGVTTAMVKVGYEYSDCKDIMWDVQTTKLSGHDMSISEVGGWNLDIHHRYNFHEGILQKGDGSNIYLKHKPRVSTLVCITLLNLHKLQYRLTIPGYL